MGMPTGDSPQTAEQYYLYLQGHQLEPHGRVETWHIDWTSLAWLWGFVLIVILILFVWIRDYRSHREPLSPLDRWGGYATEASSRVPLSMWIIGAIVVALGAVLVIGHLISGQKF
jgi:heme/copper-type cytochrome/quinol oxidase subunit 2